MLAAIATVLATFAGVSLAPCFAGAGTMAPAPACSTGDATLQTRADQVAEQVGPVPDWPEDLFHPELFKEISPARLRAVFVDFHASCGSALLAVPLEQAGPFEARFRIDFEKERAATLTLRLEPVPPHRVTAFFLSAPTPSLPDFAALERQLDALPGTASMLVVRLTDDGPHSLYEHKPDVRLGVGSAFKLYVLGALVADVTARRRSWNDTLVLTARHRSLPSGILQTWPAGSPVTLHTLATLMISRSDNTATDHLIDRLGRTRVEAMLATMGHGEPTRNRPLLMTRELFLLRGANGGAHADRFLALAEDQRRTYLSETLAKLTLRDADPLLLALPEHSARIEWFASARDLCLALDWLRRETESAATATARDLLAVNIGPVSSGGGLAYVGYKGGATGGVLNHTWLARTRDGTWLAVAATWNDPLSSLDAERFAGLAARALHLAVDAKPTPDD